MKTIILLLFACISYNCISQEQLDSATFTIPKEETELPFEHTDSVLKRSEKMPEFPGGNSALSQYVAQQLIYPIDAIEQGIEGMVVVRFTVDTKGKVRNPEILKSAHPLLDKAAIKALATIPDFIPGEQGGKKVNVYYMLPVNFKLTKNTGGTK